MFGKGVYFADMVSKSANYCHTSQSDPVGLLLLAEVALGNMYVNSVSVGGTFYIDLFQFVIMTQHGCFCCFNAGMS